MKYLYFLLFILISLSCANKLSFSANDQTNLRLNTYGLTNFWADQSKDKTAFKLSSSKDHLHFKFSVVDSSPILRKVPDDHNGIAVSDRVELFFAEDEQLNTYYGLEIDPEGRILSFKASHYRKVDFSWHWPADAVSLKRCYTSTGYIVEGKIKLTELKELNLIQDNKIKIGIFRADYYDSIDRTKVNWFSLKNPKTREADFHVPEAFLKVEL